MALPPEQEASYAAIIDEILARSDLSTVTAKRIRKQLQDRVGYDLTDQKDVIKELIHSRFDKLESTNGHTDTNGKGAVEPAPTVNGAKKAKKESRSASPGASPTKRSSPSDESDLSDVVDTPKPKKKRVKTGGENDDAAFAARLQAEENSKARPTRGGATKKRAPAKKEKGSTKKKKSATKVKGDDDSDVMSGSEAEKKERKGGFHKPMALSEPLAAVLGETQLSRPQTVKKIWEYVKARDLQDPADKRQIRCDEALRAVFKADRVHMFTMNKILSQNLYPVDE